MKTPLLLLSALAPLLAAPGASPLAAPPAVQDVEITPEDKNAFLEEFNAALETKDRKDMASLVKRNREVAELVILDTCEQISEQTSEELEIRIDGLATAWEDGLETRFGWILYEYFSLMRVQVRTFREQKVGEYQQTLREFAKAAETMNIAHLDQVAENFAVLAEAFENAGDHYYAGEAYARLGDAIGPGIRGSKGDKQAAGEAYAKAVAARERIELYDSLHSNCETMRDQLLGEISAERERAEADAAEGFDRRVEGAALAAPVITDTTFELLEEIDEIFRPVYRGHDLPIVWRLLSFGSPGSTAEFITMEGGRSPVATRTGAGVELDVDRDGTADVEIPLTGNAEPVEFPIGSPDATLRSGMLAKVLTQSEVYQGITTALQAAENLLLLWYAPAGSVVGTVGETPIRVIDDNFDGIYGSEPTLWTGLGLTAGTRAPDYDTMVIDEEDRAQPWSQYAKVGDDWYELLSIENGRQISAAPAKLETGRLELDYDGRNKPEYLIVQGSGTFAGSYFDVAAGGRKGIEVPVGSYSLFAGEIRKGSRTQVMKAQILPGQGMDTWTVNPGETTTIELGAPFSFVYSASASDSTVTVDGDTVVVVGSAGERYERLWNCTVEPEVSIRKAGTSKRGKGTEMELVRDQDTINTQGFAIAWFPLDLELEKKDDEVELQLAEKKNPLFGKIESEWLVVR